MPPPAVPVTVFSPSYSWIFAILACICWSCLSILNCWPIYPLARGDPHIRGIKTVHRLFDEGVIGDRRRCSGSRRASGRRNRLVRRHQLEPRVGTEDVV